MKERLETRFYVVASLAALAPWTLAPHLVRIVRYLPSL